jgi:hypothetical protein
VSPPRAVSTPISYPAQGQGEQEVVLELTIGKHGVVTSALAISGELPVDASEDRTFLTMSGSRGI